jgi:hypothetical protein
VAVTEREMRDVVGWTVEDTSPGRAAGRRLGAVLHAVSTVVTFGADATSGARRPTWSLPADPGAFVDLGEVRLRGTGGRSGRVTATRGAAWLTPVRADRPPERLRLEPLGIVAAAPRSRPSREASAPWTLTLTDGSAQVTLEGAWLALAWLGHLAGWPEPHPEAPPRQLLGGTGDHSPNSRPSVRSGER